MAHQPWVPLEPEAQSKLEDAKVNSTPFREVLGRLGRNPASIRDILFGESESKGVAAHESALARDAEVTPAEAEWLKALLDADGARDELEQALLDFLAEDGVRLP